MRKIIALVSCLFAGCSQRDYWRESVYAEARSRGLSVTEIKSDDGYLVAYEIVDPTGRHEPFRVGANK